VKAVKSVANFFRNLASARANWLRMVPGLEASTSAISVNFKFSKKRSVMIVWYRGFKST
jgi:hypothetical protein